jgi:hypothetical protein
MSNTSKKKVQATTRIRNAIFNIGREKESGPLQ